MWKGKEIKTSHLAECSRFNHLRLIGSSKGYQQDEIALFNCYHSFKDSAMC